MSHGVLKRLMLLVPLVAAGAGGVALAHRAWARRGPHPGESPAEPLARLAPDEPDRRGEASPGPEQSRIERLRRLRQPLLLSLGLGGGWLAQSLLVGGSYALAGLVILLAGALVGAFLPLEAAIAPPGSASGPRRVAGWRLDPVGLALAALGAIGSVAAALSLRDQSFTPAGLWLYVASLASVLAAARRLGAAEGPARGVRPIGGWLRAHGTEVGGVVAVTAWGAFLRFAELTSLPYGVWYDEARMGLDTVANLVNGGQLPVYARGYPGALVFHLLAASYRALGPTVFATRLVPALAGVATVPVAYLCGRRIAGPSVGFAAAFLTASLRWHVNWSRGIILDAVFVPLVVFGAVYLLARGLRTWRPLDFAGAGVVTGLGLYVYFPGRALPALVVFALAMALLLARGRRREVLLGAAACLFAFAVTTVPLGRYAFSHPADFNERLEQVSVFGQSPQEVGSIERALLDNAKKHLLMFNVSGDRNGRHNIPGEPMLDPLTGALFLVGLGCCLARVWRLWAGVLLAGLAGMLALGIASLTFEAPQSLRSFGAFPAVVLMAALPLGTALGELKGLARGRGVLVRLAAAGVAFCPLGFIGYLNYDAYFVRQAANHQSWTDHSVAQTIVGYRLAELTPAKVDVYASAYYRDHVSLRFVAPKAPPQIDLDAQDPLPVVSTKDFVYFFVSPERPQVYAELRRLYPNATFTEERLRPDTPPVVLTARLSRADVESLKGLDVRVSEGVDPGGRALLTTRVKSLDFEPAALAPEAAVYPRRVEATGVLRLPEAGEYVLSAEGSAGIRVAVDDGLVLDGTGSAAVSLARGNHRLRIELVQSSPDDTARLFYQPSGEARRALDSAALYASPVTATGLQGSYYAGTGTAGKPAIIQMEPTIDYLPHVIPLSRPYTVEWTGRLVIDRAGTYRFATDSVGLVQVYLDGRQVIRADGRGSGSASLTAGEHDVRVVFFDDRGYSRLSLTWTPPDGRTSVIPTEKLLPPIARPRTASAPR